MILFGFNRCQTSMRSPSIEDYTFFKGIWVDKGSIVFGPVFATATFVMTICFAVTVAWADPDTSIEPVRPIPVNQQWDRQRVSLGKSLFSDSRLSAGNGVSCSSCHLEHRALTDGTKVSPGLPGAPGETNTPTLFNVSLSPMHGWAGQSKTLEQQVDMVVQKDMTMSAKWSDVIASLNQDNALKEAFAAIYKDGITKANVIDALVEYEKSLVTPNAPFDKFLRGETAAISEQAKAGYQLFKDYGCSSCHQGVNVGGNMFQVFGIFGSSTGAPSPDTPGSAKNTGIDDTRPVFRVPPLRNVAETAPYFHDGSVETLPEAIRIMANRQLGRNLADEDVEKLYAFLKSLTGEYEGVSVGKQ